MANVTESRHDVKVFFRRLVVPGESSALSVGTLVSPADAAGLSTSASSSAVGQGDVRSLTRPFSINVRKLVDDAFSDYKPEKFRRQVRAKAEATVADVLGRLAERKAELSRAVGDLDSARDSAAALASGSARLVDQTTRIIMVNDRSFLESSVAYVEQFAAATEPSGPAPRDRDRSFLLDLRTLAGRLEADLAPLSGLESGALAGIKAGVTSIVDQSATLDAEAAIRSDMASALSTVLALRSVPDSDQVKLDDLNALIAGIEARISVLADTIRSTQDSVGKLIPFFEPILLACLVGPTTATTSGSAMGQPGTASVTFSLPLAAQNQVPDLFMALDSDKIFDLDVLERAPGARGTGTGQASFVPASTLSILKPNMRETDLRPFDMMQVWYRRRYATGYRFPEDYYPAFTGFVTRTAVGYTGSQVTVTVNGEDTGKILRLARVNIDPAFLPEFRPRGIDSTVYNNYLQSPTFATGADIIRGLVVGAQGAFLGLSQVELTRTVDEREVNGQRVLTKTAATDVVSLATDFERIPLNLFEDLSTRWKPYVNQFKSAFKLWQTDYRTKWDICREVAGITEFMFYADNLGAINYHPPLYMLNPFDPQYLIQDVDIKDESHIVDEAKVVTVVDVQSQPSFMHIGDVDVVRRISSLVSSPEPVLQRYGVRWAKKDIPIFSGIEPSPIGRSGVGASSKPSDLDKARTTYARAWLNRRNAEMMSADVTINGTPEIRLGNTVAFVGDGKERLRSLVPAARIGLFESANVQKSMAAVQGAKVLNRLPLTFQSVRNSQMAAAALDSLKDVLVYHVSGVTHTYVQGRGFWTRLTLTHGRHWTDPLPFGGTGFGLDGLDTNDSVGAVRAAFGQDGANAAEFALSMANTINFISTGNPTFLPRPAAGKPRNQFGFVAGAQRAARAAEPVAVVGTQDPKPECPKLTRFPSLPSITAGIRKVSGDVRKAVADILSKSRASIPDLTGLGGSLSASASAKLSALPTKLIPKVEADPQYAALRLLLKQNPTVTERGRASAGNALPSSLIKGLGVLGLDTSVLLNFTSPIIVYDFVAETSDGKPETALNLAESVVVRTAAPSFLATRATVEVLTKHVVASGRSRTTTPSLSGTTVISKTADSLIVQGVVVVGRRLVAC